ncbi:flagellar hook-associated protein FlgK [Diaminobutyricibacter tongyongensis]|uniref:Flagellar hook-associated protein 1 n=1 Tax=Leifsonia tongyongensis TaxID=1268043 RepID=A0A6L9XVZ5_9MICO|nr:flagellar hook-associated protein FlgK [Diaminobutyricibacter tongyongensis]NEN05204.1 flagellar hook-associated protein FlgK [Diaminobutyricibacter tongyongensis]
MSTFGGLGIAYSGLQAARAALDVTGQNITNAGTSGYTRQNLTTIAAGAPAHATLFTVPATSGGQGVTITGVGRIGDLFLDGAVRNAASQSGYAGVQAGALTSLEQSFNEPGDNGISSQLHTFWASWQDLANRPGDPATGSVVIQNAGVLASTIATGYKAADAAWTNTRSQINGLATELNSTADQVAVLNRTIRSTVAAGGNANDLIDQRAQLTATIAQIAGGKVVDRGDGTVDVTVGGNLLVTGTDANHVQVTGATTLVGAAASPVQLEWAQRPGQSVGLDSGELAGGLALVASANATGTGGPLAETAASYNQLATSLATQVNAIHSAAATTDGRTGLDFFALAAGGPAALSLSVVPTSAADIAVGKPGAGALDGSAADALSQIGTAAGSPDSIWMNVVTTIGAQAKTAIQQSTLADGALKTATSNQASVESVDLDEENMNMLSQQKSYQAAARVMTAVDDMLDTLINKTGLVGRS